MKVAEPPKVIRTMLGLHLVRLTETKPPRQISFEEARPEILVHLQNAARRMAEKISPPNGAEVRRCVVHGFGIEFVRA